MLRYLAILIGGLLASGLIPQVAVAQKLHAIVVADLSPWAGWGTYLPSISMDTKRVYMQLHNQVPPAQLVYREISFEEDVVSDPQTILELVGELRPAAEDTVLVYYTGHGGNDDRGHHLELANGKLYREDLKRAMEAKGARFNVLITDCCNLRADGESFFAPMLMPDEPRVISPLFRSLFFSSRGWVDMNGSSPGEAAFVAPLSDDDLPGSLFTTQLTDFLENHRKQPTTWEQLVREVSLGVAVAFKTLYPRGAMAAKGAPLQTEQNVEASSFPGMPERSGPRSGLTVRDEGGRGARIITVKAGQSGDRVFHLGSKTYGPLRPGQVIIAANGQPVTSAAEFVRRVQESPQVIRLQLRDGNRLGEVLLRLRY